MKRQAIQIDRRANAPAVECEQCSVLRPDATRARVRVHVQNTGHTVRVSVEHITVYRPTIRSSS